MYILQFTCVYIQTNMWHTGGYSTVQKCRTATNGLLPPTFFFAQASVMALGYTAEMWDSNNRPTALPPLPAAPYQPPFKRKPKP